ncbi:hypothetical protein BLNAU_1747 [Blattamonas nauphoetae]|uniref:Acid phosphatase n=1 Tax=Blattamonas nauphoetae TaxID=2049346 RepID=A0ABQ9YI02_9EUKA|nr:hypothetical protein BLNAU_1747 [Blattamonas nauphoetae]
MIWKLYPLLICLLHPTLVSVTVFSRHGERTALNPLNFFNKSDDPAPGHLTNLGMKQHHHLGNLVREHYLSLPDSSTNTNSFFNFSYSSSSTYFRASPFPRTIQSAAAQAMGLFPKGTSTGGEGDDTDPFHTIPIQSEHYDEEALFAANHICPYSLAKKAAYLNSSDHTAFVEEFTPLFTKCSQLKEGMTITASNFAELADEMERKFSHKELLDENEIALFSELDAAKQKLWSNYNLNNDSKWNMNQIGLLFGEIFFKNPVADLNSYKSKIAKSSQSANAEQPSQSYIPLRIYVGHDFNLWNILRVLQVDQKHLPYFASAFLVELHVDDKQIPFVKLFSIEKIDCDSDTPLKDLLIPIQPPSCPVDCPLSTLQSTFKNISFTGTVTTDFLTNQCGLTLSLPPTKQVKYKGGSTYTVYPLLAVFGMLVTAECWIIFLSFMEKRKKIKAAGFVKLESTDLDSS